jgi:multidrug transporter EmrE-like cation transporter
VITAGWPRLVIGTLLLFIGAAVGFFAWAVETCTGGNANSLWTGAIAAACNVVAWMLLGRRVPSKIVLFVAALPTLAAVSYTISTLQLSWGFLAHGQGTCSVITGEEGVGLDGRELFFVPLWWLVCGSFWAGLIPVVMRALRVHGGLGERE